jgi:hypothetical protein
MNRSSRRRAWIAALLLVAVAVPLGLAAQRGGRRFFGQARRGYYYTNVPYDGRFTVVRIRYLYNGSWSADYPEMERNLSAILGELTSIDPHLLGSNVHTLDDPELLKYPVAYLTEPGYWYPTDEEVLGLREYLSKGGFLFVDDFHYVQEWVVFESAIRRVLPDADIVRLDVTHPIFNAFFELESLDVPYPGRLGEMGLMGEFYGIYRDNDPEKELDVIGDYMEWSPTDRYAFAPTNEAYKFAINFIVYGMTH